MPPPWLTGLSWVSLAAGLTTAGDVVEYSSGAMPADDGHGRRVADHSPASRAAVSEGTRSRPEYGEPVSVAIGVTHCGAACTLGDVLGAWIVFATG